MHSVIGPTVDKKGQLEIVYCTRRLQKVVFDLQMTEPRMPSGNRKALAVVEVLFRHVTAKTIPDEGADTVARMLVEK